MVRRGSRTSGPSGNNTSSTSSGSTHNEIHWKSLRPPSANNGDTRLAKSTKSTDSTNSSPASRNSTSPTIVKKCSGSSGKGARSSSNWRSRVIGGGRNVATDSKFTITSEDFPALPGARGANSGSSQSTPLKNVKKEKDIGKLIKLDTIATNINSGVLSGSRGHTEISEHSGPAQVRTTSTNDRVSKNDIEHKKKAASASTAPMEPAKRKNGSPIKNERVPRGNPKHVRITVQQPVSTPSPKKKTINANAANTTPSFMKLSKVGQKVPERRGGPRVNSQTPSSVGSASPITTDKENKSLKESEIFRKNSESVSDIPSEKPIKQEKNVENASFQTLLPPSHSIFHATDVPQISISPDGELSNIPPSMLTNQFGMAALVPVLDIVRNRSTNVNFTNPSDEKSHDKVRDEHIEMLTFGFDLNELYVPMKMQDMRWSIWGRSVQDSTNYSQKTVWDTFAGPFGTQPLLPTNMGLTYNQVPNVYYTARTLQSSFDMLHNIPEKFGVHELFYIFYNLPKEIWQLNAARELQYRGWRYNIKEKLWVHKKLGEPDDFGAQHPFTHPGNNQNDEIAGIFEIYDSEKARICSAELSLRRSDFEVPAWEQKNPDTYSKLVSAVFPKEMLWGPREDRKQFGFMQSMAGLLPGVNGRNKLSNLVIPKQQSSERRLLSFVDSPDITPTFDNPFGSNPATNSADELYRQQMYAMILQKMQIYQQQQFQQQQQQSQQQQHIAPSSSSQLKPATSSSTTSSNYFQS